MEQNANTRKSLQLRALQILQEKDVLEAEVEAKYAKLKRWAKYKNPNTEKTDEDN